MVKVLLAVVLVSMITVLASASPLLPVSPETLTAVQRDDVLQVKDSQTRPYGWSKGRKVGWHGKKVPPGHQKKRYR